MITVKLSYSILNAWAHYQYEQAIGLYLGKPLPATPQMELGSAMDKLWTAHVEKHKTLPDELGGGKLDNPVTQTKYQKIIPLNENMQILLRGVPDMTDGNRIIDYKCGMTEANGYVDAMQLDYYKLLYPAGTVGEYRCYNPYFKTLTIGIKFLDRSNAEAALEHLLTYGTEIIDYLMVNKLLQNYKM